MTPTQYFFILAPFLIGQCGNSFQIVSVNHASRNCSLTRSGKMADRSNLSNARPKLQMSQIDEKQQKLRLREEVENPFRKVRFFLSYAFIGSASIGLIISLLRAVALSQGIDQGQTFTELAQNIGIDVLAVLACSYIIRQDKLSQDSKIKRMEVGAKLGSLKVRMQENSSDSIVPLSAFRRERGLEKRVAIVAGGMKPVSASLDDAALCSVELSDTDVVIVPLILEKRGEQVICCGEESNLPSTMGQKHVALPIMLNAWQEWVDVEVATARSQGIDVLKDGFAVILKKNGKVGTRSKGCPPWTALVRNVKDRQAKNMDTSNI